MEPEDTKVAMAAGGLYSKATRGAWDVIVGAIPMLLDALAALPSDGTRPFTMTDMGCADGGTSSEMVREVLTAARQRWPGRPIQLIYTDQPRNDYNPIFLMAHDLSATDNPVAGIDNCYVMASATSFFRSILPPGTLDPGFSATAMHWLSRKPCDIPDFVHAVGASGDTLRMFKAAARRDWETILLRRAKELAPGGRLVLINFCRDEHDRWLGHTEGVDMFGTFDRIWRTFMADGTICEAEYAAMTLPQYYRTVDEVCAPLNDPESAVYQAGLRLEHCETRVVPCPFAAALPRYGDAAAFARDYVPTLRSWSASTFLDGLDRSRPEADRHAIIDRFYGAYEDFVRQAPADHRMDYVHTYMTIARI